MKLHWYLPTHGDTATIADNQGGAQARARSHLEPTLENVIPLSRAAKGLGFEAALTPTGSHCEDAWPATVALAQHTRSLRYLVAFRPGVLSPTLAAQEVSTYQRFTRNRLALNVVTGGDDVEMRRSATPSTKLRGIGARASSWQWSAESGPATSSPTGGREVRAGARRGRRTRPDRGNPAGRTGVIPLLRVGSAT